MVSEDHSYNLGSDPRIQFAGGSPLGSKLGIQHLVYTDWGKENGRQKGDVQSAGTYGAPYSRAPPTRLCTDRFLVRYGFGFSSIAGWGRRFCISHKLPAMLLLLSTDHTLSNKAVKIVFHWSGCNFVDGVKGAMLVADGANLKTRIKRIWSDVVFLVTWICIMGLYNSLHIRMASEKSEILFKK